MTSLVQDLPTLVNTSSTLHKFQVAVLFVTGNPKYAVGFTFSDELDDMEVCPHTIALQLILDDVVPKDQALAIAIQIWEKYQELLKH